MNTIILILTVMLTSNWNTAQSKRNSTGYIRCMFKQRENIKLSYYHRGISLNYIPFRSPSNITIHIGMTSFLEGCQVCFWMGRIVLGGDSASGLRRNVHQLGIIINHREEISEGLTSSVTTWVFTNFRSCIQLKTIYIFTIFYLFLHC